MCPRWRFNYALTRFSVLLRNLSASDPHLFSERGYAFDPVINWFAPHLGLIDSWAPESDEEIGAANAAEGIGGSGDVTVEVVNRHNSDWRLSDFRKGCRTIIRLLSQSAERQHCQRMQKSDPNVERRISFRTHLYSVPNTARSGVAAYIRKFGFLSLAPCVAKAAVISLALWELDLRQPVVDQYATNKRGVCLVWHTPLLLAS